MNDAPPPVLPNTTAPYRDRRTGLIVFGIFEILGGCFLALTVPLTLFGQMVAARQAGHPFDATFALSGIATMAAGAVAFIWLGVGSIQARRWARALLLIAGWAGLVVGVISLGAVIPMLAGMEDMMRQQNQTLPPAAVTVAKVAAVATIVVMYILIPGALVLFYRSPHVKRTCEVRDPVERWTDRAPLPVIAMCLLQCFGAASIFLVPQFGGAIPLAGEPLTGWPARLLWILFSAVSLYAARGFYRLDRRAWWIYTIIALAFWLNFVISLNLLGVENYYRATGIPEWQIEQITRNPMMQKDWFAGLGIAAIVPFVGFLLYLRRYFPPATRRPTAA